MSQFNGSNASTRSTPMAKKRPNPKKPKEDDHEAKKTRKMSQSFMSWLVVDKEKKTPRTLPPIETMPNLKPFEIKDGVTLAPSLPRAALTQEEGESLMTTSLEESNYLASVKGKKLVGSKRGWVGLLHMLSVSGGKWEDLRAFRQTTTPLEGLCEMGLNLGKVKLLQFHTNQRPAYYGTWRKQNAHISGRRPFSTAEKTIDYENDSDLEWEEDPPDAEECNSDDDKENEGEENSDSDDDDLNGWLVTDGYTSAGEGGDSNGSDEDSEKRRARLEKRRAAMKAERREAKKRRQSRHLIPSLYGPTWTLPCKEDKDPMLYQLMPGVLFDYSTIQKIAE